jgi:hypothetical protein
LERRELEELVEDDVGVGVLFDFDDEANGFLEIAFVADSGDAFDPFGAHQVRDLFDDSVAGLLEGDVPNTRRDLRLSSSMSTWARTTIVERPVA